MKQHAACNNDSALYAHEFQQRISYLLEYLHNTTKCVLLSKEKTHLHLRKTLYNVTLSGGLLPVDISTPLIRNYIARWKTYRHTKRTLELTQIGRHIINHHGIKTVSTAVLTSMDKQELFRQQHQSLTQQCLTVEGVTYIVSVHDNESPLTWLYRRRDRSGKSFLSAEEFQAGERLRRDITTAQLLPHVTMRWEESFVKSAYSPFNGDNISNSVVTAKQRLKKAIDAVGPEFSSLLIDTCGFLKSLDISERERQWPARSGKVILKLALGKLATHYGLTRHIRCPSRSIGIESWRASAELEPC
jgi:hypothetical protein